LIHAVRLRSLRCSAPDHDLAHLDTNSLVANRWIRAERPELLALAAPVSPSLARREARGSDLACVRQGLASLFQYRRIGDRLALARRGHGTHLRKRTRWSATAPSACPSQPIERNPNLP